MCVFHFFRSTLTWYQSPRLLFLGARKEQLLEKVVAAKRRQEVQLRFFLQISVFQQVSVFLFRQQKKQQQLLVEAWKWLLVVTEAAADFPTEKSFCVLFSSRFTFSD